MLKLSSSERKILTEVILDETAGAESVFVGVGAESVPAACELARFAEQAGADAVVVPPPVSGGGSGPEAVRNYIVAVASAVSLPVMIQDAPAYLGVALGPELVRDAAREAPNIRLVKLEAGPAEMSRWLDLLGESVSVWGGDGGVYMLDCLRIGAAGIIPGVDLVDRLVQIYELEQAGDEEGADEQFSRILPTLVFEIQHSIDHFNVCAKHVLVRRGVLTNPALREPAARAESESLISILDRYLDALELTDVAGRA